jgi:hypothetical protein
MSSSNKRKHKTLTLSAKTETIKKLGKGEKLINLAKEYGIGRAMIYVIRKNREKSACFVKNTDNGQNGQKFTVHIYVLSDYKVC